MGAGQIFVSKFDCEHYDMCVEMEGGEPDPDACLLCQDLNADKTYNVVVRDEEDRVKWMSFSGTNVAFDLKYRAQLEAKGFIIIDHGMSVEEAVETVQSHLTPDDVIFAAVAPAIREDGEIYPGLKDFAKTNALLALYFTGHRRATSLEGAELSSPMISNGDL